MKLSKKTVRAINDRYFNPAACEIDDLRTSLAVAVDALRRIGVSTDLDAGFLRSYARAALARIKPTPPPKGGKP